ncbi:hypothetical protein ACLOJK_033835 [Asimina triloba]
MEPFSARMQASASIRLGIHAGLFINKRNGDESVRVFIVSSSPHLDARGCVRRLDLVESEQWHYCIVGDAGVREKRESWKWHPAKAMMPPPKNHRLGIGASHSDLGWFVADAFILDIAFVGGGKKSYGDSRVVILPGSLYLAQNRYFEDESFIGYLKYLQYWHRPEYIRFIMYPHCLFFLELLQNSNFRNAMAHPGSKELAHRQQFFFWKSYRNNRLKHILPRPLPPEPPTAPAIPPAAAAASNTAGGGGGSTQALSPMQYGIPPGSLSRADMRNSGVGDRRKRKCVLYFSISLVSSNAFF